MLLDSGDNYLDTRRGIGGALREAIPVVTGVRIAAAPAQRFERQRTVQLIVGALALQQAAGQSASTPTSHKPLQGMPHRQAGWTLTQHLASA